MSPLFLIRVRSLVFGAAITTMTLIAGVFYLACFFLPYRGRRALLLSWVPMAMFLIRHILGIHYQIKGRENIPDGPFILGAKHQSAWETIAFSEIFPDLYYVFKRELMFLPVFGWYLATLRMVPVDRSLGAQAIPGMVAVAKKRLEEGGKIVIYPQGTRVAPAVKARYRRGIAAIYEGGNVPIVPIALNSGVFWPRNAIIKYPGVITISFLPPILPGLPEDQLLKQLEAAVEQESDALLVDAYAQRDAALAGKPAKAAT